MKRILCAIVMLCMMVSCAWGAVEINKTNFPDDVFRNQLLEFESSDKENCNGDGWLSNSEISIIKSFYSLEEGIKTLKGIEYLTELEYIFCCKNELTELDLSSNKKLRGLECWNNKLTKLDLSPCRSLEYLVCEQNYIQELGASGLTNLVYLNCDRNTVHSLDISGCVNLRELYCRLNTLPALDVSGCTKLVSLDCCEAPLMTSLNVSGCSELRSLICGSDFYSIGGNSRLSALNVSGCPKLQTLYCAYSQIQELNLSNNPELNFLNCANNYISVLDVSKNKKLERMSCGFNQIASLNLTNNSELVYLNCISNRITALDVSKNSKLTTLYCDNNELKELNLSSNYSLKELQCTENRFAALDLRGIPLSPDAVIAGLQIVGHLVAEHDKDNASYPYYLDFSGYMASSQTGNIIASTVKGFDEDNTEISTLYSAGKAQFADIPSMVRYSYTTGLGVLSMDVTIVDDDFLSLSLNNHVYRIFPNGMNWDSAKAYCESLGGHLATVSGDAERELLQELCSRVRTKLGYDWAVFWTGGELRQIGAEENRWQWITGEEFTETVSNDESSTVWSVPYYGDIFFHNLAMYNDGYLTPGLSTAPFGFICEWEPEPTNFAPYSEEYLRYIADPDAYFSEGGFSGAEPEPVDYSHLALNPPVFSSSEFSSAALETEYNPINLGSVSPNFSVVSPVRDQTHNYRTCWAFAALGSLETSYIHQGYGSTAPDLSELHLAWYTYMNPHKDYREQMTLARANDPVLQFGGTNKKAIAFLSRSGVASENDLPYTITSTVGTLKSNDIMSGTKLPEDYEHPLRLKEVYELGPVTADNRDTVKTLIKRYGAVSVTYDGSTHQDSYKAYYHASQNGFGHAVSIIGWDENYSRSNFNETPSANGAWLAKNSYGTNAGEYGFFWLSYEQVIGSAAVYVAADSKVNKLYGHDAIAAKDTIPHNWSAVIFRAQNNETFKEASFQTRNNNVNYAVYINRLGSDTEPSRPGTPGTPLASGKIDLAGYHTVELDSPFEVKAGEYFSVILRLEDNSGHEYISAVEDTGMFKSSHTITVAGKSYFADVDTGLPVSADWKDGKQLYEEGTVRDSSCGATIKIFSSSGSTNPTNNNTNTNTNNNNNQNTNTNTNNNNTTSGSSGGGGGCNSAAIPAVVFTAIIAVTFLRRRK